MIKIIDISADDELLITMGEMKPLQIAIVKDKQSSGNGEIVMRTADKDRFEVMSLSKPGVNQCWTSSGSKTLVELIRGTVTLTINNKEE